MRIPLYASLDPRPLYASGNLSFCLGIKKRFSSLNEYTPDTQKRLILGGSSPRSNPLAFYIPFLTEKVSPSNTFYRRMILLSYTYLRPLHLFNWCKCTVFRIWIKCKTRTFSRLFHSHKMICKPFWAFAQTKMTDFRTRLYTSTRVAKEHKSRKFTIISKIFNL